MKPKLLRFPLLALALSSPVSAGQFVWTGGTSSSWADASNWTNVSLVSTDTFPNYGSTYASDFLNIKNNGDLTALVPGTTPGATAVYNPGAGVTTTFGAATTGGRGLAIGTGNGPSATPPNVKGYASLTISSGTIAVVRNTNVGSEPYMANRADADLLINGGNLDLSAHANNFRLIQEGFSDVNGPIQSTITINSGSLSCRTLDLVYDAEADPITVFGTGTINLNGGTMTVARFARTATSDPGQTSFTINLNGGILRPFNTQTSPNVFFADLADTKAVVKAGGAIIDTNTFNATIVETVEHDSALGATPDGGLTKNGKGNLTLSGTNTYTGGTIINAGVSITEGSRIILGTNDSSAGTGSITLANSYAELQLGVGRNISNALAVSDTGNEKTLYFVNAGAAEYSGPITINETNIDHFRVRVDDNCYLTFSGQISGPGGIYRYQNGSVSNSTLYLTNPANNFTGGAKITLGAISFVNGGLGTTGAITMDGGTLRWDPANDQDVSSRIVMVDGKTATLTLAEQTTPSYDVANVTFANAIGNGSTAALVKTGPGTLTLTQPSTYSGGTTITQGTLGFATGGLGTSGSVTMNGGTLRWETGNTEDVSARILMVNAKTALFSTNGNNITFATAIGNSSTGNLTKTGSGTLTLSGANTYTGTTSITQGTLSINSIKDYGVNSAIGAPASGDIQLGGGNNFCNLHYTGTGDSTNRTVKLGDSTPANTGVGNISNNGTGPLTFTAANFNPIITGITAARTLWLGGSYTGGNNEIQGIIQDNDAGGKVNLGKANDASTWLLSGVNSYTGSTIVQGGALILGASGSISGSSTVSISAGGTLDTTAKASYAIPAGQPVTFGIDATGSGSSGKIAAAGLDITNAQVTFTGTPDDPVYVLATYTSLTGTQFASVTPPAGYTLDYSHNGNSIALVPLSVGSAYDTWKSQITNGQDGRTQDADGDGFNNLQEFLFGTSPIVSNGSLSSGEKSGTNLIIRWKERTSGATYTLKQSATLNNDWITSGAVPANDGPAAGDYQPRLATIAIGGGKLFFRVEGIETN